MARVRTRPTAAIGGPTTAEAGKPGAQASMIWLRLEKLADALAGNSNPAPPIVPIINPKLTMGEGPLGSIGSMPRSDKAKEICHCRWLVAEFSDGPKPLCSFEGIDWPAGTPVSTFGPSM